MLMSAGVASETSSEKWNKYQTSISWKMKRSNAHLVTITGLLQDMFEKTTSQKMDHSFRYKDKLINVTTEKRCLLCEPKGTHSVWVKRKSFRQTRE
jgi:hypothetical protein